MTENRNPEPPDSLPEPIPPRPLEKIPDPSTTKFVDVGGTDKTFDDSALDKFAKNNQLKAGGTDADVLSVSDVAVQGGSKEDIAKAARQAARDIAARDRARQNADTQPIGLPKDKFE